MATNDPPQGTQGPRDNPPPPRKAEHTRSRPDSASPGTPSAARRPARPATGVSGPPQSVSNPTGAVAVADPPELDAEDDSPAGLRDNLARVPKWVWAVAAVVVVAVVAVLVVGGGDDKSGSDAGETPSGYTIEYRNQLTQDGLQAGCFVLMSGDRAIGISCLPPNGSR